MTSANAAENSTFGMLAVALGFLAFAGAVGHFFAGPFDQPPPVEVSIAEKAVSIRDATVAALKGEDFEAEPNVRPRNLDDYLVYSLIAAAVAAILMSVIAFIKQERLRPAIAGAALGGLAITFQFVVVVFFALLGAIILAGVIDKLDFDF